MTDPLSTPADALKSRTQAALRREPSETRPRVARRESVLAVAGFAAALGVFAAVGGFRDLGAPRPPQLIAITLVGTIVLAIGSFRTSARRAGLPASREALLAVLLGAPLALFAWKTSWSAAFDANIWWPTRPGLLCLAVSLTTGGVILASLLAARRHSDPVHPHLSGAALGVASGAAAAVFVDLWCPVGHPAHVALGHALPMLLLGLAGAWPGGRLLALGVAKTLRKDRNPAAD